MDLTILFYAPLFDGFFVELFQLLLSFFVTFGVVNAKVGDIMAVKQLAVCLINPVSVDGRVFVLSLSR